MYSRYGEIKMNRIIKAFTVVEILIVMVIISVISVITISSSLNMDAAKEKKLITQSHTIYSTAEIAYREIIANHSTSGNITSIRDANGDGTVNSQDMKTYLMKYMDGEEGDCNNIYIADEQLRKKYLNSNVRCFSVPGNITVGVEYDSSCSMDAEAREFLDKENSAFRVVDRVCTRIVYGPVNSRGLLGRDLFIIAMGKMTFK